MLVTMVRDDIALGVEAGDYQVPSVNDASGLLLGTTVEAIQRLIMERGSLAYVQGMTSLVPRSLGVDPARADRSVAIAFERLFKKAPGTIE